MIKFTARQNLTWVLGAVLLAANCCQADPLNWVSTRAQAVDQALSEGKRILLMAGRPGCSTCDIMELSYCEMTDPYPIKPLIESEYVPWKVDIDQNTEWLDYTAGLSGFSLPLICWIDPAQPTNYLYRASGLILSSNFYRTLYSRAASTNAAITKLELASGAARLSVGGLTYGAEVQIERSANPGDPNGWIPVANFACQSKTTNWVDDVGSAQQMFYRVSSTR